MQVFFNAAYCYRLFRVVQLIYISIADGLMLAL